MKPAPICLGARQHTDGCTWARFVVKVQGETAACRDVLNMLFPSGEVAQIIALSVPIGKPIRDELPIAILQSPQAAIQPTGAQQASMLSRLPDNSMLCNGNSIC